MGDVEEIDINEINDYEDILKTDISTVIAKKLDTTNFVLINYKLEPLRQRLGLLGDHSILCASVLNINGEEEKLSFFVKYFPKYEAVAKFADGIGAFSKEMFMYNLFNTFEEAGIDIISSVIPRCYIAHHNKYLILDNLTNEGYTVFNKHATIDYNFILIILQSLAKLHASSIIYEEKISSMTGQDYRLIQEYEENLEESFFNERENFINIRGVEASIKCILKEIDIFQFPDKLKSGKSFTKVAKEMCEKIYELVKPSKKYRNVVSHGDLWSANVLIKYDAKNQPIAACKFVDFQCGRYVPPAQDVLSLLYLTTSRDFRTKYMYEVIGMYYSYLEKYLKFVNIDISRIIPFSDFMESCEEQKLFGIIQTAIYFPLILIDSELVEQYMSNSDLNQKALFEDRSYLVLEHMNKDESYTNRLKESIHDLRDYCEYK